MSLQMGSRGPDVAVLQAQLNQVGNYSLTLDGVFGTATYDAVRDFQANNGLAADGVVGSDTQAALAAAAQAANPDWGNATSNGNGTVNVTIGTPVIVGSSSVGPVLLKAASSKWLLPLGAAAVSLFILSLMYQKPARRA